MDGKISMTKIHDDKILMLYYKSSLESKEILSTYEIMK